MHDLRTHPPHNPIARSFGAFNWRHFRSARHAIAETPQPTPQQEPLTNNMQIAVTIAMPRPALEITRQKADVYNGAPPGLAQPSHSMPELCLGLTQVQGVGTEEWMDMHSTSQPVRPLKEVDDD